MMEREDPLVDLLGTRNASLKEQVDALNDELAKLREERDQLHRLAVQDREAYNELAKVRRENVALRYEADGLGEELARLREELAARPKVYFPQEDVPKLLAERDSLRKMLNNSIDDATTQGQENARLRERVDNDRETIRIHVARADKLREEKAQAGKTMMRLMDVIGEAEAEIARLRDELVQTAINWVREVKKLREECAERHVRGSDVLDLRKDNARLREDAEAWRWLCDNLPEGFDGDGALEALIAEDLTELDRLRDENARLRAERDAT